MRDRPPPPPSLSIDLRAEEKFRNASLNRDAMQKKKEERKEKKKKLGHRFGLSFQPLLFNLTLSSLESVPLKDESRGDEDLGRRDRRGSLGWSPNRRHIFLSAFALHPPPPHSIILHPFVSTGSVSLLENLFIGPRALEGVHGTRTPSTTLLPLLNSGAAVDGPSWTPKSRRGSKFYERNGGVVGPDPAIPLAILPTTGCGQRVQTDGSGSWDGREGWVVVSFVTTGPSGNSPSTGSQNAMVPRFRAGLGPPSPPLRWIHLNVDSMDWLRWEMLILEVIPFHDRSVAIDFFLWDRSVSFRQLLLFLLSFALEILFWNYRMFTYPWWNVYFYRRVKIYIDLWMIWFLLLTFFFLDWNFPTLDILLYRSF